MRWYGRLRRQGEIAFVRRRGRQAGGRMLVAYAAPTRAAAALVAVTVSKAVGSAVARNRVRRRVRGALDALPPPAAGLRLLFVAKTGAAAAPYAVLAADVAAALRLLETGSTP